MALSPLLRRYDHALLDLDGCVWVGDEPTAKAVEAVTALRRAGKGIAFITNDSRASGEDLVRKLWRQGFQASLEEVVTVGGALQHLLAERGDRLRSAFVIGSDGRIHWAQHGTAPFTDNRTLLYEAARQGGRFPVATRQEKP